MTFKKVSQLSNNCPKFVESALTLNSFDFVAFDPKTGHITRRSDRPFTFDPNFWRSHSRLSVYLLCFPDEFDPSSIQQSIEGVVFVRLVKDVQKNIFSGDESLRDLEESFNSANLNDSDEKSPNSKNRNPHAILCEYFECCILFLLKSCVLF